MGDETAFASLLIKQEQEQVTRTCMRADEGKPLAPHAAPVPRVSRRGGGRSCRGGWESPPSGRRSCSLGLELENKCESTGQLHT